MCKVTLFSNSIAYHYPVVIWHTLRFSWSSKGNLLHKLEKKKGISEEYILKNRWHQLPYFINSASRNSGRERSFYVARKNCIATDSMPEIQTLSSFIIIYHSWTKV